MTADAGAHDSMASCDNLAYSWPPHQPHQPAARAGGHSGSYEQQRRQQRVRRRNQQHRCGRRGNKGRADDDLAACRGRPQTFFGRHRDDKRGHGASHRQHVEQQLGGPAARLLLDGAGQPVHGPRVEHAKHPRQQKRPAQTPHMRPQFCEHAPPSTAPCAPSRCCQSCANSRNRSSTATAMRPRDATVCESPACRDNVRVVIILPHTS